VVCGRVEKEERKRERGEEERKVRDREMKKKKKKKDANPSISRAAKSSRWLLLSPPLLSGLGDALALFQNRRARSEKQWTRADSLSPFFDWRRPLLLLLLFVFFFFLTARFFLPLVQVSLRWESPRALSRVCSL